MKHIVKSIILVVTLLALTACTARDVEQPTIDAPVPTEASMEQKNFQEEEPVKGSAPGKLVVNGKDITEGNYVVINYAKKNAEVPFLAIMRELGYKVEFTHNANTGLYAAQIGESDLFLTSTKEDFGIDTGNSDGYTRKIENDDFIFDVESLFTWLYWGWDIDIEVDFDTGTVYVNSFDPDAYEEYPAQLIINGKDITEDNPVYIREYYTGRTEEIPLLAIVKELGAEVVWTDNATVTVNYEGQSITFDLTKDDFGYMCPIGGISIRKQVDDELYMEYVSVKNILKLRLDADITIDYTNRIVEVN